MKDSDKRSHPHPCLYPHSCLHPRPPAHPPRSPRPVKTTAQPSPACRTPLRCSPKEWRKCKPYSRRIFRAGPQHSRSCEPCLLVSIIDRNVDQLASASGFNAAGSAVAAEIGAKYIECSAKTGAGVHDVFNLALRESMRRQWTKSLRQRRCVVV